MKQWVDVPTGWAYGWPKLYDPEKDGDFVEWIRSAGYKGSLEDVDIYANSRCEICASLERIPLLAKLSNVQCGRDSIGRVKTPRAIYVAQARGSRPDLP